MITDGFVVLLLKVQVIYSSTEANHGSVKCKYQTKMMKPKNRKRENDLIDREPRECKTAFSSIFVDTMQVVS